MGEPKLVRDLIPEIIAGRGGRAVTHVAEEQEYKEKLEEKLLEEVRELLTDRNPEEMADVLEVLRALAEVYGFDFEQAESARIEKLGKRGGFDRRIILDES